MSADAFRFDELTGTWVAVAPGRVAAWTHVKRPAELPEPTGRCPFCPGHESDTQPIGAAELRATPNEPTVARAPATGPWRVRVVANLFPLVTEDAREPDVAGDLAARASGRHEVVVEHPMHDIDLPDYDEAHLVEVLSVYRERMRVLREVRGTRFVSAFRNRGRRAGSSQPHPHGQIVAVPVEAPDVVRRADRARAAHARDGRTLLETIVERELAEGARVVDATSAFVVLCPFAPRQSHHAMIIARDPRGDFADASDSVLRALAPVLRATVRRVRHVTGDGPYNIVFRTPAVGAAAHPSSAWHLDVLPRRGGCAGFELSTGIDVVPVPPEESARALGAAPA